MSHKIIKLTHNQYQILLALADCAGLDCVADKVSAACNEVLGFDQDNLSEEEIEASLDLENELWQAIGEATSE